MYTHYRLETWVSPDQYHHVCRELKVSSEKEARSIVKLYEMDRPDEPDMEEVNRYLDLLEGLYPYLDSLKIEREAVSLWMESVCESECSLSFDPLTLIRLGQEKIKPCLSFWRNGQDVVMPKPITHEHQAKPIEIEDIWIEREELGYDDEGELLSLIPGEFTEVYVRFSDQTVWHASCYTYSFVRKFIAENGSLENSYLWKKNMIFISRLEREGIENLILNLLDGSMFEYAFEQIEGEKDEFSEPNTGLVELNIIHESAKDSSIAKVLGVSETQVVTEPTLWSFQLERKVDEGYVDHLGYLMDLLEGKFEELAKLGIQKMDISIRWTHYYEDQCHLEFIPDILERMGKKGITLELICKRVGANVARCLE